MKQIAAFAGANWRSGVAGAISALAVVIVWTMCMTLARWSAAISWIEHHPGLAAWVQAVFSVVAIGASSFFAFWAPLHPRDLGERDTVQRAINTLLMLVNTTRSTWDGTRQILDSNSWHGHSGVLILDGINAAFTMANLVPASMQLGEAFTAVDQCRSRLVVLKEFISRLDESADVQQLAKQMPFQEILGDLAATVKVCGEMKPLKVAGSWMIFAPGDMKDHPAIKAAAQRAGY